MANEDFRPVRLGETRVANRCSTPIGTRFDSDELEAIAECAAENGVRRSDVIRGALVYAGVLEAQAHADEDAKSAAAESV